MTVPMRPETRAPNAPTSRAAEASSAFGSGTRPIAVPPVSVAVPSTRSSAAPASYRLAPGQTVAEDPAPAAPPAKVGRAVSPQFKPDRLFHAARVCLKQSRLDDALLLIRQARAAEPEQVQYLALHAWLRVQRGELKPGAAAESILDVLNRAVRERPADVDIRMYRARALQRLGRDEEAHRDFCVVAKVDRLNVDAAEAVRRYEARAGAKPPKPA